MMFSCAAYLLEHCETWRTVSSVPVFLSLVIECEIWRSGHADARLDFRVQPDSRKLEESTYGCHMNEILDVRRIKFWDVVSKFKRAAPSARALRRPYGRVRVSSRDFLTLRDAQLLWTHFLRENVWTQHDRTNQPEDRRWPLCLFICAPTKARSIVDPTRQTTPNSNSDFNGLREESSRCHSVLFDDTGYGVPSWNV